MELCNELMLIPRYDFLPFFEPASEILSWKELIIDVNNDECFFFLYLNLFIFCELLEHCITYN